MVDKKWKSEVFFVLRTLLEANAASALGELESIALACGNETKSSAGDKYETAREMLSQARALQTRLLEEAKAALEWLDRQDPEQVREKVAVGALVRLDDGWILVTPFPAQLDVVGRAVRCLSLASPLGQALKGARAGESRVFRDRAVGIRE
ncbi:MAG TPA: hypothetical protein PKY05_17140, partial [Fibrobacteria bacterium]|nr:hypothetical protein [Fibrobacteria bacterium]